MAKQQRVFVFEGTLDLTQRELGVVVPKGLVEIRELEARSKTPVF